MQIKISNLKLKNFKGIKNLEINFEGKNANIYGKNATGKTTVFDAFKWLFFDKDSSDRKDFNIKTLDENNKPIHNPPQTHAPLNHRRYTGYAQCHKP